MSAWRLFDMRGRLIAAPMNMLFRYLPTLALLLALPAAAAVPKKTIPPAHPPAGSDAKRIADFEDWTAATLRSLDRRSAMRLPAPKVLLPPCRAGAPWC